MAKPNKTQPTQIMIVDFVTSLEAPNRREEANALMALFEKVTGQTPQMWGPSIIGFGMSHYLYDSGRTGTMPAVAFSPRKAQLVLYGLGGAAISAEVAARLGKYSTGKGCVYIKKLQDIDLTALAELITHAWASHQTAP